MSSPVVWFEVLGADGASLQKFYANLFDWNIKPDGPPGYGMVTGNEKGIPGGIGASFAGTRPGVTFYVESKDINASLAKATSLGGRVLMPRTEMPDVTLALFEDPEGHAIGLVEAKA